MKTRTPAKKAEQKARTSRNKVKKYKRLIEERPNHEHRDKWEAQIKYNQ